MTTIKLSEAKAHLGAYARRVKEGESFIISDRNRAIAQLVALPPPDQGVQPVIGLFDGQARIPDDFDQPLPEFETLFYGE